MCVQPIQFLRMGAYDKNKLVIDLLEITSDYSKNKNQLGLIFHIE